MANSNRTSFLWPSVATLDDAKEASKGGGFAFGFITLGYVIAAIFTAIGWNNPLQPSAQTEVGIFVSANALIAGLAGYLAWRTYRRPTVILCILGLSWILIEFIGKANAIGVPHNVIGAYWGPILGTIGGIAGVRGALAVRKFSRNS